jgi:hypothetical protein
MLELLERQTARAAVQQKTIVTANGGDISEDVHRSRVQTSLDCAAPADADDRVAFALAAGQWPRVFPGL